jgi:hypothetical protein
MKTPSFNLRPELSASANVVRLNRWLLLGGAKLPARRGRMARAVRNRAAFKSTRGHA